MLGKKNNHRRRIVASVKNLSSNAAEKIVAANNAINNFFTEGLSYDGFNGPEDLQKAIAERQMLSMG